MFPGSVGVAVPSVEVASPIVMPMTVRAASAEVVGCVSVSDGVDAVDEGPAEAGAPINKVPLVNGRMSLLMTRGK